jgi:hypothetical protein
MPLARHNRAMFDPARPALAFTLAAALAGCGSKAAYPLIGMPFCVSEDPAVRAAIAGKYVLLVSGNGHYVSNLQHGTASPAEMPELWSPDTRAALIECAVAPDDLRAEWADELSADAVPTVCPDQKLVFNRELELVQTDRSKALGYGGFLRFPSVELECAGGSMIQSDRHTLAQIFADFVLSVERYQAKHETLPLDFGTLAKDVLAEPLPPDPWGTELAFRPDPAKEPTRVRLVSAGPDKTLDSPDDIEMLSVGGGGAEYSMAFTAAGQPDGVNYEAWLRARGVGP